jgi:hypothetical protein
MDSLKYFNDKVSVNISLHFIHLSSFWLVQNLNTSNFPTPNKSIHIFLICKALITSMIYLVFGRRQKCLLTFLTFTTYHNMAIKILSKLTTNNEGFIVFLIFLMLLTSMNSLIHNYYWIPNILPHFLNSVAFSVVWILWYQVTCLHTLKAYITNTHKVYNQYEFSDLYNKLNWF